MRFTTHDDMSIALVQFLARQSKKSSSRKDHTEVVYFPHLDEYSVRRCSSNGQIIFTSETLRSIRAAFGAIARCPGWETDVRFISQNYDGAKTRLT